MSRMLILHLYIVIEKLQKRSIVCRVSRDAFRLSMEWNLTQERGLSLYLFFFDVVLDDITMWITQLIVLLQDCTRYYTRVYVYHKPPED